MWTVGELTSSLVPSQYLYSISRTSDADVSQLADSAKRVIDSQACESMRAFDAVCDVNIDSTTKILHGIYTTGDGPQLLTNDYPSQMTITLYQWCQAGIREPTTTALTQAAVLCFASLALSSPHATMHQCNEVGEVLHV